MANQTRVEIANSGQEFQLPGTHWTSAMVASTFSDSVPGIAGMTVEETVTADGDKLLRYSPRTGTKG